MEVALTEEESSVLQEALQSYLTNLGSEIRHTDTRDYRDGLKHKRETLQAVFTKLDEASHTSELVDSAGAGVVRLVSIWWTDSEYS